MALRFAAMKCQSSLLLVFIKLLAFTRLFVIPYTDKARTAFSVAGAVPSLVGISYAREHVANLTVRITASDSRAAHWNKGLVHEAFLRIDLGQLTGAATIEIMSAGVPVDSILFRANPLTKWLLAALQAKRFALAGPLTVVRSIDVSVVTGGMMASMTDAGGEMQNDKFAPSTLVHLRHLIGLAAEEAAIKPVRDTSAGPLISFIVPVFDAQTRFLDDLLASFQLQPSGLSELILSDDASTSPATRDWLVQHADLPDVSVVLNRNNGGIAVATNSGLAVARGTWIGLLDHDDALSPFAVDRIARALEAYPNCQFLYTDEVLSDKDLMPIDYFLKPAWDDVLLSGVNYINHLSLYRRDRLNETGPLNPDFDGSQDYDLLLRYTQGLDPAAIMHLPYPAYIWRRSNKTYSTRYLAKATANARDALARTYASHGPVTVGEALSPDLHRVRFDVDRKTWPFVSIIVPNKNSPDLIRQLLAGLFDRTNYTNFEVIVVDNGTTDKATLDIYDLYTARSENFKVIMHEELFNFSRSINRGIERSNGELILFLNNDIEIEEPDWLQEMASCFAFGNVGIVGAKLLYPSRKLQHAGVIAGFGGYAGHWFIGYDERAPGPMGRLWVRQTFSCVTGACMLVARDCIETIGLLDEENFAIAYNDIDFCLRATNAGFRVIWTPFACLVHHESASRGSDETPQNVERFEREKANLQRLHATSTLEDPTLNPWYSRGHSAPRPIYRKTLPTPRRR